MVLIRLYINIPGHAVIYVHTCDTDWTVKHLMGEIERLTPAAPPANQQGLKIKNKYWDEEKSITGNDDESRTLESFGVVNLANIYVVQVIKFTALIRVGQRTRIAGFPNPSTCKITELQGDPLTTVLGEKKAYLHRYAGAPPVERQSWRCNGVRIHGNDKTLQELGLKDNDVVIVKKIKRRRRG